MPELGVFGKAVPVEEEGQNPGSVQHTDGSVVIMATHWTEWRQQPPQRRGVPCRHGETPRHHEVVPSPVTQTVAGRARRSA